MVVNKLVMFLKIPRIVITVTLLKITITTIIS